MNIQDLTKGNISGHLVRLAVPLIVGNILQQFYNTLDAFVVGKFAGKEEFAAIGIAGTVMNLFLFAVVGCCTGFSVLFARCYGSGDKKGLREQHFSALVTGMTGTLVLAVAGVILLPQLLGFIQTPDNLFGYTEIYLRWIFLSMPAAFLYNLYASILRAAGDTKAALVILGVSVGLNFLLDLWFVAVFREGISGAAKATALTQLLAAAFCFVYISKTHRELLFRRTDCHLDRKKIQTTAYFGMVTALHQSGLYLGKMLVQGAVNTAGTDTIAAYTAATRIEGFANSFGDSGAAATSIVTAQNYGAGKRERVRGTFFDSLKLLAGLGIACAVILYVTADGTIGIMLGDGSGAAFTEAVGYLKLVAVFYLFCFTGNTFAGYFDGIGKVSVPFVGAIGHITLRVILSWLFISRFGLHAVAAATGIGWILVNLFWMFIYLKNCRQREAESV